APAQALPELAPGPRLAAQELEGNGPGLPGVERALRPGPPDAAPGHRSRASGGLQPERRADGRLDLGGDLRILLQVLPGVVPPLPAPLVRVREPGAALLDDPLLDRHVEDVALAGDALAIHHVELGLAEGRRQLVLHHLDLGPDADRLGPLLERVHPPDV